MNLAAKRVIDLADDGCAIVDVVTSTTTMMRPRSAAWLLVVTLLAEQKTSAAPAVCRSCAKNCFAQNSTIVSGSNATLSTVDVDLMAELEANEVEPQHRRTRRDTVEQRACSRFQVEMLLIPLAIAMIPLVLCALFVCTCCCGPKESRGKLPEDFLASLPMSKKSEPKLEEFELEFGPGYVQRKDSSKTKFSTTVKYIEARRESLWSANTVISEPATDTTQMPLEPPPPTLKTVSSVPSRLMKQDSCDSAKKTRFSDTVSVISVESLARR
ncbi:unnamed protein product [Caenorhabditis auriculariae]|uniref:Uncharacterized protein n=1 Tax=Caenorhabditis auriculariae TaxID=2777116 RepID=A0A8S1H9C5_9PELO|nr:unnamed protein product [Caenorhabditis auriculariae]